MKTPPVERMLSTPAVARRLGVDRSTAISRIERAGIEPDAILSGGLRGESLLFRERRLGELARALGIPSPAVEPVV